MFFLLWENYIMPGAYGVTLFKNCCNIGKLFSLITPGYLADKF